jgi:hypothetical protein
LDARLVERWRPGDERPEIVTEILRWGPVTGMTPVAIDLPKMFSGILGDEP